MALAVLNIRVINPATGAAVASPSIEVTRELGGALVQLYSDRAGATPVGNPFTADSDGKATLYPASGGAFKVRAYTGSSGSPTFEDIQRYVAVGLAAETDAVSFVPIGAWDSGTTYGIGNVVSHVDGGATYLFASLQASNLNNEPDAASPADTAYWMLLPSTAGADGVAGFLQAYSTTTADADPGAGTFRLNNATIASATEAYLDNLATGGGDISGLIDTFDDSTSTVKGTLYLRDTAASTVWAQFTVTGSVTDGSGYRKLTLTHVASNGTFTDTNTFAILFVPKGDKGDTGNTGSTGAAGADGTDPGRLQAYSTTTADADPGAGTFRLDNATIASVTGGYFDNLENGGGDISAWLDTWDDSTNTNKGTLILTATDDPTVWAIFTVTGTITDGTGYRKATLTHVASNGTFVDATVFSIQFYPTGNKGADGAGSGDMQAATYDPATIAEQLVGLTAAQTLTNKTLTSPTVNTPTLVLKQSSGPTPTAEGDVQWDTDDNTIVVGDGAGQKTFSDDSKVALLTGAATLTGGFDVTAFSAGTKSTGTFTPDPDAGNFQYAVNGGAHTLAAPASDCAIDILYTNNGSAGTITFSGFQVGSDTGDALTTTDGHDFLIQIRRVNSIATYAIKALQ